MAVLVSVFSLGYKGKTVNFSMHSPCHRTTLAHFLNRGKWDDPLLEDILKASVVQMVYQEAVRSQKPVFCIVDDTIASKTKPSSQALHPIEDAYFHQSHLKNRQDYGHQAVAVMLSCNGLTLNYAVALYDRSKSKIRIVQDVAGGLPEPPVPAYFLCDCWYTSKEVINAFKQHGFLTIGALKTNRIIYPVDIRMSVREFASHLRTKSPAVRLGTVNKRRYYVYRYEGRLNDGLEGVVLITYPKGAFRNQDALRAFLCLDKEESTKDILNAYLVRWKIEVFFRQSKEKLAFDQCQVRSSKGIRRYWLLMSLAYFLCCTGDGGQRSFETGYSFFQQQIWMEQASYIYQCGVHHIPFQQVFGLAG